jgi:hypothetical protein
MVLGPLLVDKCEAHGIGRVVTAAIANVPDGTAPEGALDLGWAD